MTTIIRPSSEPGPNPDMRSIPQWAYAHPQDRIARRRLEKLPGMAWVFQKLSEYSYDESLRHVTLASAVRVRSSALPELAALWKECTGMFGVSPADLYVLPEAPWPWAVRGVESRPIAVVSENWVKGMEEQMTRAMLARLAASIQNGNVRYVAAADFLTKISSFLGLASTPLAGVRLALEEWRRYSTFTADRAAVLCCGSAEPVLTLLKKLAGAMTSQRWGGVTLEALVEQGREYEEWIQDSKIGRWQKLFMAQESSASFAVIRISDLLMWIESDTCKKLFEGIVPDREEDIKEPDEGGDLPPLWGEFVGAAPGGKEQPDNLAEQLRQAAGSASEAAKQGLDAFGKALDAFFHSLRDSSGNKPPY